MENNKIDELKKEWANDNKMPLRAYSAGSHIKAGWICIKGHRWKAEIRSRFNGTGCPYCSGRYAIPGETDLKTVNPELASQWDMGRNDGLMPEDVTAFSNRKVWWTCKKGHHWQASVAKRSMGKMCPYCGHKRADEKNNLAVYFPKIAAEWDKERNARKASDILPYSNAYAWWICRKGHSWRATVNSRTRKTRPNGCPYCSGRAVIAGETDLATTDPELAEEWNKDRNIITPDKVSRFSHKKIYWNCPKGHVYKMMVANRSQGKGCSICYKRRMKYGRF